MIDIVLLVYSKFYWFILSVSSDPSPQLRQLQDELEHSEKICSEEFQESSALNDDLSKKKNETSKQLKESEEVC